MTTSVPTINLAIICGLVVGLGLALPAASASTLPFSQPTTVPVTEDLPVSTEHTLKELSCPGSSARVYPIDGVCKPAGGPSPHQLSLLRPPGQVTCWNSYLLQRNKFQPVKLWRCTKHTSTQSSHCGFESWESAEGFKDQVYKPTPVLAAKCDMAVRQHLWEDPNQVFHQMSEGTHIVSYVRKGALDYSSSAGTWLCRGESRTNSDGNLERSVLERVHLQFNIKVITSRYNLRERSVQLTESVVLPTDRWSSAGAAVIEGVVYLLDRPGSHLPVCNLRLIK